ncbi:MAG: hypothetical protein WC421_01190 [Elusimicrobiales bacterium]
MNKLLIPLAVIVFAAVSAPANDTAQQPAAQTAQGAQPDENKKAAMEHFQAGLKYYQNAEYEKARNEWMLAMQLDLNNADASAGLQHLGKIPASRPGAGKPQAAKKKAVLAKDISAGICRHAPGLLYSALKPGLRAVPLSLPEKQLRLFAAGDMVDALVTLKPDDARGTVTLSMLQNVPVLCVDRKGEQLVLGLSQAEAQYAVLAQHEGDVKVILRAPGDEEAHPLEAASFRKLFAPEK